MTGTTTGQTSLTTVTDTDDTEVYLTTGLVAALQALANLFESATGHDHSGSGKGKPIVSAGIASGITLTAPHFTTPVVDSGGLTLTAGSLTVSAGDLSVFKAATSTGISLAVRAFDNANTGTDVFVIQDGTPASVWECTKVGNVDNHGTLRVRSLGAFASGDHYVIADASGNLHLSALGPAS